MISLIKPLSFSPKFLYRKVQRDLLPGSSFLFSCKTVKLAILIKALHTIKTVEADVTTRFY